MRSLGILATAAAVIAVPVMVHGAEPAKSSNDYANKRICTVEKQVGSRISRARRCRTQQEEDALRAQQKRTIERVQANKVSFGR